MSEVEEVSAIRERYLRRSNSNSKGLYSMLSPDVWQGVQERQRALISLLSTYVDKPLNTLSALEVGCGAGGNLLELLRLGFAAENLMANELLPERAARARDNLPAATALYEGDATEQGFTPESFDIVYQSTVFSSLLDAAFQEKLAATMWDWVRPGGGVLWYDFTFDNPKNVDVQGVTLKRIRELFPVASIDARRVTLAPPISRRVCKIHPSMYTLFGSIPFLRTHLMCWIGKPV